MLTATFKDLHIKNSKNYKRWYCLHHTDCVCTFKVSSSQYGRPRPSDSWASCYLGVYS